MSQMNSDMRAVGRSEVVFLTGDITKVAADAIVNAANSAFSFGGGVDGALRHVGGPELSGEIRRRYPTGIETGRAVSTGAYDLPARWVIHATGPVWNQGGQDKLDLLASALCERAARSRHSRSADGHHAGDQRRHLRLSDRRSRRCGAADGHRSSRRRDGH